MNRDMEMEYKKRVIDYICSNEGLFNQLLPLIYYNTEYQYKDCYIDIEEDMMDNHGSDKKYMLYWRYENFERTNTYYIKHKYDDAADSFIVKSLEQLRENAYNSMQQAQESPHHMKNHQFNDAGNHVLDREHFREAMFENDAFFKKTCTILCIGLELATADEVKAMITDKELELKKLREMENEITLKIGQLQSELSKKSGFRI